AAHDVVAGGEVEAGLSIERALHPEPAVGDPERLLAGGALEQARQARERLDFVPVLLPALHRADVQAQGEGGIRWHAGAVHAKARARDFLGSGVDRGPNLVPVALAHRTGRL